MALGLYKCSCGPRENTALTTKHLLRSLPKFVFSGLCYEVSLNNNLFIRLHEDLLVLTVWPDTKRMEMKWQTVSALAPQSAAALEQLNGCFSPPHQTWPLTLPNGMKEADWGVQGALFEQVWQIQGAFLLFSFFLLGEEGQALPQTTEVFSLCQCCRAKKPSCWPVKRNSAEDINVWPMCCLKWMANTLKTIRLMGVWGWLSLQRGWKAFLS